MKNKEICLFENKSQCCACGACMNICPKQAITMEKDDDGFVYPQINKELCVGCGACQKVCAFQRVIEQEGAMKVYAATRNDLDKLKKSTSGGIFATVAEKIIEKKGIVYGACMVYESEKLFVKHVGVDNLNDLQKLQGSKYVQSEIGHIYSEIKQKLQTGVDVLFSGTPCQVAGLKAFLNKEYENLLTIDIICHGVPSIQLFQEHINLLEKELGEKIKEYQFRDKENGWGLRSRIVSEALNGEEKEYHYLPDDLSYYSLFLKGYIYRENCYQCKYTNSCRPGDITIGDYWGIGKEHPEFLSVNGGQVEQKNGISAVIANTKKGIQYMEAISSELTLCCSDFEKVARGNAQLREPCKYPAEREKILKLYRNLGYEGVDKYALKLVKRSRMKTKIKSIIKCFLHIR